MGADAEPRYWGKNGAVHVAVKRHGYMDNFEFPQPFFEFNGVSVCETSPQQNIFCSPYAGRH